MKGTKTVVGMLNKVLTNRTDRHQPVFPARPHVRQLGLRAARRVQLQAVDPGDEGGRHADRPRPLPGGLPNLQNLGKLLIGENGRMPRQRPALRAGDPAPAAGPGHRAGRGRSRLCKPRPAAGAAETCGRPSTGWSPARPDRRDHPAQLSAVADRRLRDDPQCRRSAPSAPRGWQ